MKFYLVVAITIFLFASGIAQNTPLTPTPPKTSHTSSHSKSSRQVSVDIKRDTKLNLQSDNQGFSMNITHPKNYVADMKQVFNSHFGGLKNGKYEWESKDKQTEVRIKKNRIYIDIDKTTISDEEMKIIEGYTKEILNKLDWDIEELGLWNYSGDWTLSK